MSFLRLSARVLVALFPILGGCQQPEPHLLTLRELYGVKAPDALVPSKTAIVLVDFQEEFFQGRLPVHEGRAAVAHARSLLDWARAGGVNVVHVHNVVTRPDTPIFAAASPMVAPVPDLTPRDGEMVVVKHMAGAFSRTDLDSLLRARGIDTLIVAGIMTHLAVDTTVRDASVLGYHVLVAEDACTTRALPSPTGGTPIPPQTVHKVALASLADRFADIRTTREITAIPLR